MSLVAPNLTYLLDVTDWDPDKTYFPVAYQGIQFTQYGMAVVTYQNVTYVMNNTTYPQKGIIPPSDTAWSILGSSGSGGGTVLNVSSSNKGLNVENPTTTPVITDVVDNARGLAIDDNGKYIKVDNTTIQFDGTGALKAIGDGSGTVTNVTSTNDGLLIDNGTTTPAITDVVDNARGLAIDADGKYVKVDGVTMDYDANGALKSIGTGSGIVQTIVSGTPDALTVVSTDPANPVLAIIPDTTKGVAIGDDGLFVKTDGVSIIINDNGELESTGASSTFVVDPSQMRGITTVSAYDNNSLSTSFIKDFALSINNTTTFYYVVPVSFTTSPSSVIKADISFNLFAGKDLVTPESFSTSISMYEKNDNNTSWSIVGTTKTATLGLAINENKTIVVSNVGNATVSASTGDLRFLFSFSAITQVGEVAMLTGLTIKINIA